MGKLGQFFIVVLFFFSKSNNAYSQSVRVLELENILNEYCLLSTDAQNAKLSYRNSILQDENLKKEYLPILGLTFNPVSFNRSLRLLQSPIDGSYSSIEDYSNNSNIGLSIKQKVPFTDGTLSFSSNASMLNEFSINKNKYNVVPYIVGYQQSVFGVLQKFKLNQRLNKLNQNLIVKGYVSKISSIQEQSIQLFLKCCSEYLTLEYSKEQLTLSDSILSIVSIKYHQGLVLEREFLLIELQKEKDYIETLKSKKRYDDSLDDILSYFNITNNNDGIKLRLPEENLPICIDLSEAYTFQKMYNPQMDELNIRKINSEKDLLEYKLKEYVNAIINVSLGTNNYSSNLIDAYHNPYNQQSISLSLSLPIFDWGVTKSKVLIAKNNFDSNINTIHKDELTYSKQLKKDVDEYNFLVEELHHFKKTYTLTKKNYELSLVQYNNQSINIEKLIEYRKDVDNTYIEYISRLSNLWCQFFKIRTSCLYDFGAQKPLIELFSNIILNSNI